MGSCEEASAFLSAVYAWMCAGLAITAATSWFVAASPTVIGAITANGALFWILAIAQLAIVFVLSARVQQLAASTAEVLFVLYSALTGVTMAFLLLAFTGESVATTFLVTAGMFGGLAIYGTVTKRNLGGLGQFLFMGLLGVVLASFVGLFWHSDAFQFVLSLAGVIVFSGLAAYDAQRSKFMALQAPAARRLRTPSSERWRSTSISRICFSSCCGLQGAGETSGVSPRVYELQFVSKYELPLVAQAFQACQRPRGQP